MIIIRALSIEVHNITQSFLPFEIFLFFSLFLVLLFNESLVLLWYVEGVWSTISLTCSRVSSESSRSSSELALFFESCEGELRTIGVSNEMVFGASPVGVRSGRRSNSVGKLELTEVSHSSSSKVSKIELFSFVSAGNEQFGDVM